MTDPTAPGGTLYPAYLQVLYEISAHPLPVQLWAALTGDYPAPWHNPDDGDGGYVPPPLTRPATMMSWDDLSDKHRTMAKTRLATAVRATCSPSLDAAIDQLGGLPPADELQARYFLVWLPQLEMVPSGAVAALCGVDGAPRGRHWWDLPAQWRRAAVPRVFAAVSWLSARGRRVTLDSVATALRRGCVDTAAAASRPACGFAASLTA